MRISEVLYIFRNYGIPAIFRRITQSRISQSEFGLSGHNGNSTFLVLLISIVLESANPV